MTNADAAANPAPATPRSGHALGDLLVRRGLITPVQLAAAGDLQKRTNQRLSNVLISQDLVTPEGILDTLSAELGVASTRLNVYTIDPQAVKALPEKVARRHLACPLVKVDGTLVLAVAEPKDLRALDDLRFASGCRLQLVAALEQEIGEALDRYYGETWESELPPVDDDAVVLVANPRAVDVRNEEAERSAVNIVERLLVRAATDGASDIHLEPTPDGLKVRVRIDGAFHDITSYPATFAPAILSRLKVLGAMDIAERRLPQDGRFSATVDDRRIDIRSSTYPTLNGERAVLRLLDQSGVRLQLGSLGMAPHVLEQYRGLASRPEGIILITGPTGSGKTSTLYATLAELVESKKNIITVENPVEYAIAGVNQGQTNDKAGFTFARGLRAILRQDPDIIMVGEIRDAETLETAIEASLTGHLVLSTVHTNSAISTVTRLMEMGLEPYLLASSALGFMAQRLVRRLCPVCRKPYLVTPAERQMFPDLPETVWRGAGCHECRGTGYKGRVGVYELVQSTEELRQLIIERAPESRLADCARRAGTRALREECLARFGGGLTTLEELMRVTQERS